MLSTTTLLLLVWVSATTPFGYGTSTTSTEPEPSENMTATEITDSPETTSASSTEDSEEAATDAEDTSDKRIVAGQYARLGQFPHQAVIRPAGGINCGGSLIHSQWVLTAAHCVHGITVMNNENEAAFFCWQIHPDYRTGIQDHDLAMLHLPNSSPLNRTERWVSGHGATFSGGNMSPRLKYGKMNLLTTEDCQRNHFPNVYGGHICGINTQRGDSGCFGDSGGPLIGDPNGSGSSALLGVVSFGKHRCGVRSPTVFTRVHNYLPWIKGFTEGGNQQPNQRG